MSILKLIAEWDDYEKGHVGGKVFLCERINGPMTTHDITSAFENLFPEYEFTGFYGGISPSNYIIIFGRFKLKTIKYVKAIHDNIIEQMEKVQECFQDWADKADREEFEGILVQMRKSLEDKTKMVNNHQITEYL